MPLGLGNDVSTGTETPSTVRGATSTQSWMMSG